MKTMFLRDGQEVNVVKKIEDGFLYNLILFDEYEEEYFIDKQILFTDKLYKKPPVEKLHQEVSDLQKRIQELKDQKADMIRINRETISLAADIPHYDIIRVLVDYMKRNFEYILYETNFEIFHKDKIYISPFIRITNTRNGGYELYKLKDENRVEYDDSPIRIFKDFDSAKNYAVDKALVKLFNGVRHKDYPWTKRMVEEWHRNIRTDAIKNDPNILAEYKIALEITEQKDKEKEKERLQKEIQEREDKLKNIQ